MDILALVSATIGIFDVIERFAKELPDTLEARSFKKEISSDLDVVRKEITVMHQTEIVHARTINMNHVADRSSSILYHMIPVKIKYHEYIEGYGKPREKAEMENSFNLLVRLNPELKKAKTSKQMAKFVKGNIWKETVEASALYDPKFIKNSLNLAAQAQNKRKSKLTEVARLNFLKAFNDFVNA